MAISLQEIKAPINKELEVFEKKFRLSMKSKVPLLDTIMTYIVKRKGKQLRPMFVLLTSKIFGEINERTYRGAALVELLHTATLVHDDVVDESYERRGLFSINALWKNKIAVLVGDYLLSKGLLLALRNKDHDMLDILSDAVEQMSEGELLQIEKARRLDITEAIYYDIISKKTASLIASCCGIGAASTNSDEAITEKMRAFGLKVGIAFQIKDDLFDYGSADIGKPTGIDIKEKKMTLPLIYSLNKANRSEKRRIINIVKNNNNDPKKVSEVIDFVINSGGITYAEKAMREYLHQAQTMLNEIVGDENAKQNVAKLVQFVIDRKN
ncbi:MAG: polyprenyl synthetase family protein [Bacteroidia bacterium]|jgi:octaprenyl-diphosphate synthase|nr:polyprenyl synthetase family protein [Bacteroidia bacterium]